MWQFTSKLQNDNLSALYPPCFLLMLCLLVTGCAAYPLADSIDWRTVSDENETASWSARRHNALGIKWMSHGKLAKAERHFQKAAELSPRYAAPSNNLGNLCFSRDELYLAAWQFENAAELAPHSPEPLVNLGLVFERAGQLDRAEECYRNAIDIAPTNSLAIGNLTRVLVKSENDPSEIRQLLGQIMFLDNRPEWLDWADRLLSTRFREDTVVKVTPNWNEGSNDSPSAGDRTDLQINPGSFSPGLLEEIIAPPGENSGKTLESSRKSILQLPSPNVQNAESNKERGMP